MRVLFLAYNFYLLYSPIFEFFDKDPPPSHSFSILYLIPFFAVWALILTIVQCIVFGLPEFIPEVEERREEGRNEEYRRIVSELERKMKEIDQRLEFIEISLQSTPLEIISPLVSSLLFNDSIDVQPDSTRLRSILEQLDECSHANWEISQSVEELIEGDFHAHNRVLLQWLQRSVAAMDRLMERYQELAGAHSDDNTESIPEPIERRRRKSTSN